MKTLAIILLIISVATLIFSNSQLMTLISKGNRNREREARLVFAIVGVVSMIVCSYLFMSIQ